MKAFLSILKLLLVVFAGFFLQPVSAQTGVLDPNDPVVTYNPNNPPTRPDNGVLVKWVRTKRMTWNTDSYKCYFYKNYAFRLKYPKSYQPGVNDGKKYPVFVFFHGAGELGTIYDNEYQLLHGGELHKNAVDNGQFDGYLIYPQSRDPGWSNAVYDVMNEFIMKYLVPEAKADPYRIIDDGLSSGGAATWNFLTKYPKLLAASLPISATYMPDTNYVSSYKYTPIWHFQGGVDVSPQPFNSVIFGNKVLSHGGNYRYTEYPNVGHGCWYNAWGEPDYFPFMLRANKVNPWPLYGRTEFCTLDEINVTIGVTEGFDGYEWRKDGQVIPGANSNTYLVKNEIGTYDCRIKSGNEWSYWSPTPVVVKLKQKTITPNIQLSGFTSKVIPAPDGNSVPLMLPEGYTSYLWQKEGSETILGTSREFTATSPGYYKAKVTELYGCSSEFSELFKIVDANGANGPDAPSNIIATTLSRTSIKIDWSQNANPQNNETGFEIFRGAANAGPYQLITITEPDAASYTDKKLNPGTKYFYKVRAINNNGASSVPDAVQTTTQRDTTAPTAPGNLKVVSFSGNSASLSWTASTDDVEVTNYDVYVNGIRMYILGGDKTAFTVYNLTYGKTYNFVIKARDFAGNVSVASNQATATVYLKGLNYSYYNGEWNKLPDFKLLTPAATGVVPNVTLNTYSDAENYAYLWEGTITIPVSGNYTFRTNSDDGSRLYLGTNGGTASPYSFSATPLVDNDGLHGSQDANSVVMSLTAGTYPIAISFFQLGGGANMNVYWRNPQTGNQFVAIPDSAFTDGFKVTGTAPAAPSDFKATAVSSKRIDLSWTDNSDNETGFEIYRAASPSGPFLTVAITGANKNSYIDSSLNAATTYYYRIRAIGKYGESAFNDANNSLKYSYYEGSYSALPNFDALTPKKTGDINNFNISVADAQDYFAFKFDGIIRVPADGNYTFYTTSDDGSKLYINGTSESNLVVNNDGLHGAVEASGSIFLTAGMHAIRVTFFEAAGDQSLKVAYQGPGIAKQLIPDSVLGLPGVNATTLKVSGVPTAPTNLVVKAQSPSVVKINWTDNSSQETGFEIYRSQTTNSNYVLITTVAANLQSLLDSNLNANTIYYYKVRATGLVGPSEFTGEAFDTTLNNPPAIASIGNQSMRYGTQLIVNVAASDIDGDQLMVTVDNLPSFGFFTSTGNGTGTITFNPQASDEKVYTGITVTVSDSYGGTKTISFNLTVNDNYNPVIGAIAPVTVQEGSSYTLVLNATDQNPGDVFTWNFPDLPSFIIPTVNGGSATLLIKPGFADADVYHVTAVVMDNKGGSDTKTLSVLVTKGTLPTQKIYVNFGYGTAYNADVPWNNTNKVPTGNPEFGPFKDDQGAVTTVGLKIMSAWDVGGHYSNGSVTGNNTGIYPDKVMQSGYYSISMPQTFRITGLDVSSLYTLTFFGSSRTSSARTAVYTVNGKSVSLNAALNTQNTVELNSLQPENDGSLSVEMKAASGSSYTYINALVITKAIVASIPPAAPKDLSVVYENGIAKLSWRDVAFNEDGYEVYRATDSLGAYTLLNPNPSNQNAVGYTDNPQQIPNSVYFYKVRAFNAFGFSAYATVAGVTIPNNKPVLAAIANQSMKVNEVVTLNITATDDSGEQLTLSASDLPSFATFVDNGNGTGTLKLSPILSQTGIFNVSITVNDNFGGSDSKSLSITVSDPAEANRPAAPSNLTSVTQSKTSVTLSWKDNSNNETGFEIWRSSTLNGTFELVGNVGTNATSYVDNGLANGSLFFYKVRAKNNSIFSTYSNTVAASPIRYVLNINFNEGSADSPPQPAPWNNTNATPYNGYALNNLLNDQNQRSGVNLLLTKKFTTYLNVGKSTGNNSGVFPDNVMKSCWFIDPSDTAKMMINNLNQTMKYNIIFFGSQGNLSGNRITNYQVGDQIVKLNCTNNTSNTVQIVGIVPDNTGSINIKVFAEDKTLLGYLNAMVIQGFYSADPDVVSNLQNQTIYQPTSLLGTKSNVSASLQNKKDIGIDSLVNADYTAAIAYPNPFIDDINLKVNFTKNISKFSVSVTDMAGKTIHINQFSNIPAGLWENKIGLKGRSLKSGIYLIHVVIPGEKPRTIKVIK